MQQNAYQGTLIYESIFKSVRKRCKEGAYVRRNSGYTASAY